MKRGTYEDIINLPHHISSRHPRMTIENRAAQFSPFAALTGYEDEIKETERLTDERKELDESEKEVLDRKLRRVTTQQSQNITITWFVPDSRKEGGVYETLTGYVKKIDGKNVIMKNGTKIPIENIVGIDLINGEEAAIYE